MARLTGDYEKDKDQIEHALELVFRAEQDGNRGVQIGGSLSPRLDCQIITATVTAGRAFTLEHQLGRIPRYYWIVRQTGQCQLFPYDPAHWTKARVQLLPNGSAQIDILLA